MKNILSLFKINIATYFLILSFLITGLIKNILLIYLIIIVHELGHILIIKLLKYNITKVEIYPMGGVITINKKVNTPLKHELLISVFGIVFQIILGLIFYFACYGGFIHENTYHLFTTYNLTILVFNLLPIIPLDGYIFLNTLIEIFLPYKKAFYLSFIISIVFIILFITYNEVNSLNNYLIISFLIFKIVTEFKDFKYKYTKFKLERHLFNLNYNKIKYENKITLDVLKKDTFHYFKRNNKVYSEKTLLAKKFLK